MKLNKYLKQTSLVLSLQKWLCEHYVLLLLNLILKTQDLGTVEALLCHADKKGDEWENGDIFN